MSNYFIENWNSNITTFNNTNNTVLNFCDIKANWNTIKQINDTDMLNIHDNGHRFNEKGEQEFLCMCNKQIKNRYEILDISNPHLKMIVGSECIKKWINNPIQQCIECDEYMKFKISKNSSLLCKECKKNKLYYCLCCNREIYKSNTHKCGLCVFK